MAEEIDFENGRNSNFEGLVTLTLTFDRAIRISSCISHRPLPIYQISFKLKKLFVDGRTYGWMDIFPLYIIRSTLGSRPKNNSSILQQQKQTRALAEHKLCQGHCIIALWLLNIYTLCPKKVYPLMFDNNFGKCGPIFKFFSPTDTGENFLCIYTKTSTSPAICCYTTSWNSKIQICYWFCQHQ